jgi:PAS domain S-box-containing protein
MRVLNVDDREENRYLVEALLRGHGYEVRSAANGAEALACLQQGGFDLIISDILMPVMDGFELCRKVKGDETLRRIPLIVYTATYTGPQDEAFALQIGADRFVIKPCEPDELIAIVREVLAGTGEGKGRVAPEQPSDEEVFKLYNARLVRKLEQKMLQLEQETLALREAEAALRRSEGKYRRLHESMTDGFVFVDMNGVIRESNEAYRRMLGYGEEELNGLNYRDITPEKWHAFEQDIVERQVLVNESSPVYEKEYRRRDGGVFPVELRTFLLRDENGLEEGMWAIVRDISERKRLEKNQKKLEDQLHQAQKMESVGRLAGGVAHDYNNMLSVILGYTQIAMMNLEPESSLHRDLQEIHNAASRSAAITRQLLAFARKQAIVPQILDLNDTIESMLNMLRRLIGEDISLTWQPGNDLGTIRMDPSQVDQLLANLSVNARDAISGVGEVIIETRNQKLDAEFCALHEGIVPGDYVRLTFSDTGCGMDQETLARVFEPFFTTKAPDKGTGLGLATVYGIVRQNNGHIGVYSEPGHGTTFRIYLPRFGESVPREEEGKTKAIRRGSGETILIVEDEAAILRLARRILAGSGYAVLTAATPAEAIELARNRNEPIDLLITDVIMPGMNGKDLSLNLAPLFPEMKCLFMSGYAAEVVTGQGVLDESLDFIQKPFSAEDLLDRVREALTT